MFHLAVQNLAVFSPWQLARLGWWFGFGQFASGMAWIGEAFLVEAELFLWALPFAVTGLPAGLALFHAAAFALFGALAKGFLFDVPARFCLARFIVGAQRICAQPCADRPAVEFAGHGLGRLVVFGTAGGAYRHLWPVAFGLIERCFTGQRKPPRRFSGPRLAPVGVDLFVFRAGR